MGFPRLSQSARNAESNQKILGSSYSTFTALLCKSLIINGAGEPALAKAAAGIGNRTLVSGPGRALGMMKKPGCWRCCQEYILDKTTPDPSFDPILQGFHRQKNPATV